MAKLSEKALLVSLNISQWTGRKLDRTATGTVEVQHNTEKQVGNYTKKLLPGAKELQEIARAATSLRTFFYTETLPWFNDGSRIISSKNYMEFTNQFRALKQNFENAKNDFIAEYPTLRAAAQRKLGNLFRDSEYPATSRLETAFHCEIAFMPLPDVGDFRVAVSEFEKNEFLERMQSVEKTAMKECWNRLHDVVAKATAKLQTPDGIFRDSLIENISDMCALLPRLNIMDDPVLEKTRLELEAMVGTMSTDSIRASTVSRDDAAKKLAAALSKMDAFV
jgi:hypothetical protein